MHRCTCTCDQVNVVRGTYQVYLSTQRAAYNHSRWGSLDLRAVGPVPCVASTTVACTSQIRVLYSCIVLRVYGAYVTPTTLCNSTAIRTVCDPSSFKGGRTSEAAPCTYTSNRYHGCTWNSPEAPEPAAILMGAMEQGGQGRSGPGFCCKSYRDYGSGQLRSSAPGKAQKPVTAAMPIGNLDLGSCSQEHAGRLSSHGSAATAMGRVDPNPSAPCVVLNAVEGS